MSDNKQILDNFNENPSDKQEWLRILYERHSEHFLKDNDRIWTVTSIFIPLSLAGLSSVKDTTFCTLLPIAVASIGLSVFWYITCERHRDFQNRSEKVMQLIQNEVKFEGRHIKTEKPFTLHGKNWIQRLIISFFFRKDPVINVQRARRIMLRFVIILWTSTLILSYFSDKREPSATQIIVNKPSVLENH